MALFKISKGLSANLPTAKVEGNCWWTIDDSKFYIDYKDENGILQRKALNAQDAETLTGASLATILNSNELEIPTSKAVLDELANYATVTSLSAVQTSVDSLNTELDNKVDKVHGKGLSTNDYTTEEKTKLNSIDVAADINAHDTSTTAHSDIRQIIAALGYEDVGIYISESEPLEAVDGDLWFDLASEPFINGDEVTY